MVLAKEWVYFLNTKPKKIVQINSKKVGIINRFIQFSIVGYIIGWVMIYKRGYQDVEQVVSSVTTKVKGVQFTNISNYSAIGAHLYDVADYVIPPQENGAFFIMTNAVVTPMQKQGICDEDPNVYNAKCERDSDCPLDGVAMKVGNGQSTGRCINSTKLYKNKKVKTCEIRAWCPTENDVLPLEYGSVISNVRDFTVLIKNNIEFPLFHTKRQNVLAWVTKSFLNNCIYEKGHSEYRYCPIFKIGNILESVEKHSQRLIQQGGVIGIYINWDCNMDWDVEFCNPEYSFRRLDDENAKVAKGWNFRYANYYMVNGTEHRTLIKAYGIRFAIYVTGQAGKFSLIPLTMNLGSGLALLGLATILCDLIVLSVLNQKEKYRKAKFQQLESDDGYEQIPRKEISLAKEDTVN